MTVISKKQKCQAFDPIMILPEKTKGIIDNHMEANTSCVAPAFIFLEGSRGKRYLCDYHYQYEKDMTVCRTPNLWPEIEKFIIDEREEIKKTFAKDITSIETVNKICECGKQAYIKLINKESGLPVFFCNFHFRKIYYRNYSNNIIFENFWNIIDERYKMTQSIVEEANNINQV
jgi:hypothetical protein